MNLAPDILPIKNLALRQPIHEQRNTWMAQNRWHSQNNHIVGFHSKFRSFQGQNAAGGLV